MHEQLIANLATFIRKNDLAEALLADHRCSPYGKCSCSTPNIDRPWPCTTYKAVAVAVRPVAVGRRAG